MLSRKLLNSAIKPNPLKYFSTVVSYQKKYITLDSANNKQGLLSTITQVFGNRSLCMSYIDGRQHHINHDGSQVVRFNVCFESKSDEDLEHLLEDFKIIGVQMRNVKPESVPYFPMTEQCLDRLGNILQKSNDGLNQDHPGFTDTVYKERRNLIADTGKGYKMGNPIPGFKYDQNETNLWTVIWDRLYPKLMEHGCKEYKENFQKLIDAGCFKREAIPQLEDLNQFLQKTSNWKIKPVNGILSQREFLNCLAFRTFCCTQYIRHHTKPEYTPEPDIIHEFMGHVPMFADKKVCDISQLLGMLSLGATDQQVAMLGSIYWFTIEFGMCLENGKNKFYGGGIASSYGEIDHMVASKDIRPLDLIKSPPPINFVVQDVQPFYYCAKSFQDVLTQLEDLSDSIYKPFHMIYDFRSNSYSLDRAVIMEDHPL